MKFLAVLSLLVWSMPAFAGEPLVIREQGMFSAGGVVLSTDGTFDPVHGQFAPAGQTHHADPANVF